MTRDPTDDRADDLAKDRPDALAGAPAEDTGVDARAYLSARPRRTDLEWGALFAVFKQRTGRVKSRRYLPEPGAPLEGMVDSSPLIGFEKLDDLETVEQVREALSAPSRGEVFFDLSLALGCEEEDVCISYRRQVEREGRQFMAQVLNFRVGPANGVLWDHGAWFHPKTKLWSLPSDDFKSAKALEELSPYFRYYIWLDPLIVLTRVKRADDGHSDALPRRGPEPEFNWR